MKLLYAQEEIARHVKELGAQISRDYQDQELILLVVLKGSMLFAADLCREITPPVTLEFIRVSSYGSGTTSSGEIDFKVPLQCDIAGKHVLIVEDIIDTGLTLQVLHAYLRNQQPQSLKCCTLIDKKKYRQVDFEADYVGITMEDGFIIGYGLDYNERFRNLAGIYLLDPTNLPFQGEA
ncbi:hypoxanthine phosphoribosyltransferase [Desulfuromonas acetoxidans]|uniref:hypoxanthine phosphoribosyltransferase n=1 Tax=Desulfuromonas acetoxidans TaxID=891 RepID=UPI00292CBD5B|nr:hypoxanthine phosphoribosyltransferase [Desulfuromonas acetoxidans]